MTLALVCEYAGSAAAVASLTAFFQSSVPVPPALAPRPCQRSWPIVGGEVSIEWNNCARKTAVSSSVPSLTNVQLVVVAAEHRIAVERSG